MPIWHPSPNFGPRRDGLEPSLVVLHYTAMASAEAALDRLSDPDAEVSAHYLIGADGTLWQLVREADRAWHAGQGEWRGQGDVNSRSVGIELDNRGDHPFAEAQMAVLERLLPEIMERWSIPAHGVIGHSDMAPGRKRDPGRKFDWRRLARQGLALDPEVDPAALRDSRPAPPDAFDAPLRALGYSGNVPLETRIDAFLMRFRPQRMGSPSRGDLALALGAAETLGIDRTTPTA